MRLVDEAEHLPHGLIQADEHRAGEDGVADAQFIDLSDRGDGSDVYIIQSMPSVDAQAERPGRPGCLLNARELALLFLVSRAKRQCWYCNIAIWSVSPGVLQTLQTTSLIWVAGRRLSER